MICLQSQNGDFSTNNVIEWLLHSGVSFIRINKEDNVELKQFSIANSGIQVSLTINGTDINFSEISAYWHRRGSITIRNDYNINKTVGGEFPIKTSSEIKKNFNSQFRTLENFINSELTFIPIKIGNSRLTQLNKLSALKEAFNLKIAVPETIITTEKEVLEKFLIGKKGVITKSIQDTVFVPGEKEHVAHYTEAINAEVIDKLPKTFAPSLFQEMIEKEFELRIFFLQGKFYSMAIFSQKDKQTSIDFRKYNDSNPNRTIPYNLPPDIENLLTTLMEKLGLDSGSIDMIVSTKKEFVFLEVNPVGQFGMVSFPCNYYIERDLAHLLSGVKK